jgi:hypothetical protein
MWIFINFPFINFRDRRIHRPPAGGGLLSEVGTLCLEFTKLSQLTGDMEFFYIVSNLLNISLEDSQTKKNYFS